MVSSLQSNFTSVLGARAQNPFRLRRALEKLTSLTRHIECLISFANSPRLRPALQYHMSISTVLGQTHTVELPKTQEEWKLFLEVTTAEILQSPEVSDETLQSSGVYSKKLAGAFEKKAYVCPVHCECALVQHLTVKHNDAWDNVPAFNYIGVSKLSCSACRIWLESFNEVSPGQRKFYTRGSHGKWYWPWGMPMAEESNGEVTVEEFLREVAPGKSLREIMAGKISRQYIGYLIKPELYPTGSDSTDASFNVRKH